jgi:hypothetical protein
MNIYEKFMELANSCEDYDDFEKQAMEATPDHLKESFGAHMLEWYVEFRYNQPKEKMPKIKIQKGTFAAEELEGFTDEDLIKEARGDEEKIGWYERMVAHMMGCYPEERDYSKWQVWRVLNALTTS